MIATNPADLIRQEAISRELARRSVCRFADYVDPQTDGAYLSPHLALIGQYLDRAIDGTLWADDDSRDQVKILAISTPPRHWKSSLISQKGVAYFVGKRAAAGEPHSVILTGYGASIAEKSSRAALETVQENKYYQNLFPNISVSRKSQSVSEWSLHGHNLPACVAAGVGGGLTGQGADMLVIDDPIKDSSEANSTTFRNRLWEWWAEVARTRINPGGFAVIVMTRWHIDDLVGRLLKQQMDRDTAERLIHLRLPALAESAAERIAAARMGLPLDAVDPLGRKEGEALWPEKYSAGYHASTRAKFPKSFDALYQGRPVPKGGFLIGRDHFHELTELPKEDVKYLWATDWALTSDEVAPKNRDPDYTVCARVGLWTPGGDKKDTRLIITDVRRGQFDPAAAKEFVKTTVLSNPAPVFSGQANVDRLYLSDLRGDADLLNISVRNLERKELKGDKVAKSQPWREMGHAGRLYYLPGSWNDEFFEEVEGFPNAAHDDQVDAMTVAAVAHGIKALDNQVKSAQVNWYG